MFQHAEARDPRRPSAASGHCVPGVAQVPAGSISAVGPDAPGSAKAAGQPGLVAPAPGSLGVLLVLLLPLLEAGNGIREGQLDPAAEDQMVASVGP